MRVIGCKYDDGQIWFKETKTAIEINAQPDRLDLKDDLVKEAIGMGVIIMISTDAHMLNQFEFMELDVSVARRGWCTENSILNTKLWEAVEAFKRNKSGKQQRKAKAIH